MNANKLCFVLFAVFLVHIAVGQEIKNRRVGFFAGLDLANTPSDRLRSAGASRKILFGARGTFYDLGLVCKLGVGFKFSKSNFIPTAYQPEFFTSLKEAYEPILDESLEKKIAESMFELASGNSEYETETSYIEFIHISIMLEKLFLKPSLSFNFGYNSSNLRGPGIYDGSEYFNHSFAYGHGSFKELTLGSSLPLVKVEHPNLFLIPSFAYRWLDYKDISYSGVPLSAYTSGDIAAEYRYAQHFYFSLSLVFWTR